SQRGEGLRDHGFVEAVGAQFGADPDRSVTRPGPHAGEACGEAGVVLPALRGHAFDGGLRVLPGDTARRQFIRQLLARMLASHQQPERTLRGAGLGPATLAPACIDRSAGALLRRAVATHGRYAPGQASVPSSAASAAFSTTTGASFS